MQKETYYKRVQSLLDPDALGHRAVAVVGLGSGGSRVAVELTRAGVGRLLLFDLPGEKIEEHNIVRHELGYSSLGQNKGPALAGRLRDLRPDVSIDIHELDVVRDGARFEAAIRAAKTDLLLACTDGQEGKNAINELAVRLKIPAVFGGVYDNGVGGEVFSYRPGSACFACFVVAKGEPEPAAAKPKKLDYSNPDFKEFRSILALNLDILQITLLHARQALDELLPNKAKLSSYPGNLLIFPNKRVEGVWGIPLRGEFYDIKPHPACLVCSAKPLPPDWEERLAVEIRASSGPDVNSAPTT